jgi:preprotein translocase subunit YajC
MELIETMMQSAFSTLAMGSPPANGQQSSAPQWFTMLPFLLLIFVFYFLMIRPQQKKAKEHENMMKGLRKGDRVVTGSGIVGVIVSVKEKTVAIRSDDTKLEVLKSAVSEITERSGDSD